MLRWRCVVVVVVRCRCRSSVVDVVVVVVVIVCRRLSSFVVTCCCSLLLGVVRGYLLLFVVVGRCSFVVVCCCGGSDVVVVVVCSCNIPFFVWALAQLIVGGSIGRVLCVASHGRWCGRGSWKALAKITGGKWECKIALRTKSSRGHVNDWLWAYVTNASPHHLTLRAKNSAPY